MHRRLIVTLTLPWFLPVAAWGQSNAADLDRRVTRACLAISGLMDARVAAFKRPARDGMLEYRMIVGRYMHDGKPARHLCVFSPRTGRAELRDLPAVRRAR